MGAPQRTTAAGTRAPVVHGRWRAWLAPGVDRVALAPPHGDPDVLLTRADCRIVKFQPKVVVGRIQTAAGTLYVKRYNVFAPRVALAAMWTGSPARGAWRGAAALADAGFETPEVLAALEYRRCGVLLRSFFVTREVRGAETGDRWWRAILEDADAGRRRRARRALARTLGDLFRRLHASGLYHNDLKDVNVLVCGTPEAPRPVLLDLERVRRVGTVRRHRRLKNLVQLARSLGRQATAADRARFLRAYLGEASSRAERRDWACAVRRRALREDRRRGTRAAVRGGPGAPRVTCAVVCQDEEPVLAHCLESVTWCDEIVVVDGGSTDRTVEIARRFTNRVLTNPWPGYVAQKQFALDAAGGDWLLNVDADERVTPELAAEIRDALASVPAYVAGFAIPRLVCYLGCWWFRGGWYPRRVVRLVRRTHARWGGQDPHERAVVSGEVLRLRWPLLHHTYADVADHLSSANKLTSVAARQACLPRRVGAGRLIAEPVWRLLRGAIVRGGAINGFPGLFVAGTDAFYVFLRWAKVWERRVRERAPGELDPPADRP